MPKISTYMYVDVDTEELETSDLIEELEDRGYIVIESRGVETIILDKEDENALENVFILWSQKNRKEAMILLERIFPKLVNISDFVE